MPRGLRSAAATGGQIGPHKGGSSLSHRLGRPRNRQLKTRILLVIATAGLASLTLMLLLIPPAPWLQSLGDLAQVSAASIATVACVRAARRGGDTARAWAAMAVTTGVWVAGATLWMTYGVALDHVYPFPSLADIGFVGYAVPAVVALLLFPRHEELAVSRLRVVLDGLVIAGSLVFVSWGTVLGDVYHGDDEGLARVVGLAYPLVDIVIGSMVLALGVRAGAPARRRWLLLGGGLLSLTITDSIFVSLTLRGDTGLTGTPLVLGWVGAFALIAAAARAPVAVAPGRSHFTVPQELLPYVPVAAAIFVTAVRDVRDDAFLLANGFVLIALVIAHQIAIAFEKVRLANNLEAVVEKRTLELADLARRNHLILSSAGDGIYGVDLDGRVTFANPAAGEMLGHAPKTMLGKKSHALMDESSDPVTGHDEASCPVAVAMRTGMAQHRPDDRFRRQDGTPFPVERIVTPIEEGGAVTGAVVMFRDITKRKEVDRLKNEFTSIVSHELRTPLTSIRGSLGLLCSGVLGAMPAKGQRMLDIAVSNTDRLIRLVNDILDIERIESATIVMDRELTSAGELLRAARDAMEGMAADANVTVTMRPVDADLWADSDRMMQTFTNLLSNAIKFSEPGGTVELGGELRGDEVLFWVRDHGRGIPPDRLDAVFERFQQIDSTDARDKGGTGLGLPICRSIVEQHGGRIWVESTLGAGSNFFFTVPAGAPMSDAAQPEPDPDDDEEREHENRAAGPSAVKVRSRSF